MNHDYYNGSEPGISDQLADLVQRGGLHICRVCGNGEGALSSHCPGVKATDKAEDIYAGKIDFMNGRWVSMQ